MDQLNWTTEKRKIDDLIPYEQNPRQMTEDQVKQLTASLEKFGLVEIPAIDTDNKIVAGHQRLRIMQVLGRGEEEIDVRLPNRKLTKEEFDEYNLRSNRNTGEWNWDMLAAFDKELLEAVGFSEELDKIFKAEPEAKDDDVPDVPVEAKSKLGEIYQLGKHRVMCGDATKLDDVEKLMDGQKADMAFTDPPYGVSYEAGLDDKVSRMKAHRSVSRKNTQIKNDTIKDDEGLYNFLLLSFCNISNFCKHGVYICYASNRSLPFINAWIDAGFHFSSNIIWVKDRIVMGRGHYHYQYEPILYGWKKENIGNWMGDRSQSNVWNVKRPSINDLHPTMKPIELINIALVNSSKQGDIILDLFLGSGSTLIAAEKTDRICYGMELDPKYVDVIIERWENYTGDKATKIN